MSVLKPVIYLKVGGQKFHWGVTPGDKGVALTSFVYDDNDGTSKSKKNKKGKRDEVKFTFVNFDRSRQTFISDLPMFRIGNYVVFHFGFEGRAPLTRPKAMKIVDIKETFPDGGIETATVICHDLSKKLNKKIKDVARPIKNRTNDEKTLYSIDEVIREVAAEEKLIYKVDRTSTIFNKLKENGWQQMRETNMQFIARLAKDYGADAWVSGNRLYFGTKKRIIKRPVWGSLHRGMDSTFLNRTSKRRMALLLNFSPKVDLEKASNKVESCEVSTESGKKDLSKSEKTPEQVADWNFKSGTAKRFNSDGTPAKDPTPDQGPPTQAQTLAARFPKKDVHGNLSNDDFALMSAGGFGTFNAPVGLDATKMTKDEARQSKLTKTVRSRAEAEARAQAKHQQDAETAVTASATVLGEPTLRAKITVTTTGRLNKRWRNHRWYIQGCKHDFSSKGYFCELEMISPPEVALKELGFKSKKKKQVKQAEEIKYNWKNRSGTTDGVPVSDSNKTERVKGVEKKPSKLSDVDRAVALGLIKE